MSKFFVLLALGLSLCTSTALRAEGVLDTHKKALGGAAAIEKIKTLRRTGEVEMTGAFPGKGTIVEAAVIGKKSYQKMDLGVFETTQVWDGNEAWASNSYAPTQPLTKEQIGQMQGIASVNPFLGVINGADPATVKPTGKAEFEGIACTTYKFEGMTAYMGDKDGLFHGMTTETTNPADGQKMQIKIVYSDFKEHGGVKFADKTAVDINDGMMVISTKYTKTEINPELDDSLFKKP